MKFLADVVTKYALAVPINLGLGSLVIGSHGLRTPNKGINKRNLEFWADVADKICFAHTLGCQINE